MTTIGVSFLELPQPLIYSIIHQWIPIKALIRLDSAACQLHQRIEYLHLLGDPNCVYAGVQDDFGCKSWDLYEWILSRRVQIAHLLISRTMSSMPQQFLASFFQHTGARIKTLITNDFFVSPCVGKLIAEHCVHLDHIDFRGTSMSGSDIRPIMQRNATTLRTLGISGRDRVGVDLFKGLLLSHLEDLHMRCGVEALHAITTACPHLRVLSCGPPIFSFMQATPFSRSLSVPTLQKIHFDRVENLTDTALTWLLQDCPNITEVDLHSCTSLTADALWQIAIHCAKLRALHVQNNDHFTTQGMGELVCQCAGTLRVLGVTDCGGVHIVQLRQLVLPYDNIELNV